MRRGAVISPRPLFGAGAAGDGGQGDPAPPVLPLGGPGPRPVPRPLFTARQRGTGAGPERPGPGQKERARQERQPRAGRQKEAQARGEALSGPGEGAAKEAHPTTLAAVSAEQGATGPAPDASSTGTGPQPPQPLDEAARAAAEAMEQAQAALQRAAAQAAAMERAQAEAESMRDQYVCGLAELARAQALDFRNLENELSDLAIEIAREILLREIGADRLYVVRLVEAALRVVVEEEAATVLIAPSDLALLEQERPRLEVARGGGLVRVTADPSLHPGDCVVQVGRARIDARLGDRLERVRQALHGVDTETE